MAEEQLGRTVMGADAAYCAVTGAILLAAARPISRWTGLPTSAVMAGGAGAAAWLGFVARSASQADWQSGVRVVAVANAVAATGLAVVATRHPKRRMRWALGAVAVEAGAFAAAQVMSLVAPPPPGEEEPPG